MRMDRAGIGTVISLLVCLLAACASAPKEEARVAGVDSLPPTVARAPKAPDEPLSLAELDPALEARVFALGNRTRARLGVSPLELRLDLIEVARAHSLDMANRDYFSHRSPEGAGPGDRAAHLDFTALGENLARIRYAEQPAPLAIEGWLKSPAHRRVLLDERRVAYRYTGVGAARGSDGTVYVTQLFLK